MQAADRQRGCNAIGCVSTALLALNDDMIMVKQDNPRVASLLAPDVGPSRRTCHVLDVARGASPVDHESLLLPDRTESHSNIAGNRDRHNYNSSRQRSRYYAQGFHLRALASHFVLRATSDCGGCLHRSPSLQTIKLARYLPSTDHCSDLFISLIQLSILPAQYSQPSFADGQRARAKATSNFCPLLLFSRGTTTNPGEPVLFPIDLTSELRRRPCGQVH